MEVARATNNYNQLNYFTSVFQHKGNASALTTFSSEHWKFITTTTLSAVITSEKMESTKQIIVTNSQKLEEIIRFCSDLQIFIPRGSITELKSMDGDLGCERGSSVTSVLLRSAISKAP